MRPREALGRALRDFYEHSWLLFAITLAITLVVFRTSRRWVYYAGER